MLTDLTQRFEQMGLRRHVRGPTETVNGMLPLNSPGDVKRFDANLKTEALTSEYVSVQILWHFRSLILFVKIKTIYMLNFFFQFDVLL